MSDLIGFAIGFVVCVCACFDMLDILWGHLQLNDSSERDRLSAECKIVVFCGWQTNGNRNSSIHIEEHYSVIHSQSGNRLFEKFNFFHRLLLHFAL